MSTDINPNLKVVVVDLDKTLVKGSLNLILAKSEARGMTALKMIPKLVKLTVSAPGNPDLAGQMIDVGSGLFVGKKEDEFLSRLEKTYRDIKPRLFAHMRKRIIDHKQAGAKIWLAGPAPQQLVDIFAKDLGADRAFGVRMIKDSKGRLTEQVEEPLVYREGKRDAVLAALREEGIDPKDVRFYSDSISDIPLLESVGEPVCTNPSDELRAEAKKRGWPIEEYHETVG